MASPQLHKSSASLPNNLVPPPDHKFKQQQRRVPSPAPPPSAIDIPQPVYGNNYPSRRSPSPLRSGFTVDPKTGEIHSEDGSEGDHDDDPDASWGRRSHSPNPSITQFASSFAQRVGSFVSSVGSAVSPGLPTDEELEREAERERDRSRREAERILTQEAEERRHMEDKVLAMLHTTRSSPKTPSTPPRAQTLPPPEASPTPSQRDGAAASSWWSAAKNRLTPTKEPLTAAQQVVQETKEREKRERKEARRAEKERKRSGDWPTTPEGKHSNPTLLSLTTPPKPSPRHATPSTPSSPTVGNQALPSSLPPSLAPSPLRGPDSRNASPSREPPPLYAQFNEQGSLDVSGTLLVIARRFEKLEKWTVGHVRALEERMGDVERWLVEKESEKESERETTVSKDTASAMLEGTVSEMRDELMEVQGRIGVLGREMAKLATAPAILSSAPSRVSAQAVSTAPQTNSSFAIHAQTSSSITVHSHTLPPTTPPPPQSSTVSRISSYSDLRRRDSVSPPFLPPTALRAETPRSRLPYPTGDYTSPPGSVILAPGGALSPPQSPPSVSASASPSGGGGGSGGRPRPISVAGLPLSSASQTSMSPGMPRALAAPPQPPRARSSSISPTPRKRYTVALGEPIMKPRMSASPPPLAPPDDDTEEDEEDALDRTIGRAAGRHATTPPARTNGHGGAPRNGHAPAAAAGNGDDTDTSTDSPPASTSPPRRPRAQTGAGARTHPLKLRTRAQSTDRTALEEEREPRTPWSASFRDPLVVRREALEARVKSAPVPPKVVAGKPRAPVGELVAFFDKS